MNKNERDREKLLAETFHGEWAAGRGAEFARGAAALVRRRRNYRRALLASGAVAGLTAAAMLFILRPSPVFLPEIPAPIKTTPVYDVISDDEFLALLHDRPLLVMPKENGTRQFVFVDP